MTNKFNTSSVHDPTFLKHPTKTRHTGRTGDRSFSKKKIQKAPRSPPHATASNTQDTTAAVYYYYTTTRNTKQPAEEESSYSSRVTNTKTRHTQNVLTHLSPKQKQRMTDPLISPPSSPPPAVLPSPRPNMYHNYPISPSPSPQLPPP